LDQGIVGFHAPKPTVKMMQELIPPGTRPARSRLHRWLLVVGGVSLVGIGGVGVFLPGLPTTVFLIGASWCFTRSCPWLEERLIRIPLFRPFLVYLDHGARMPRKVIVWTLIIMWLAIAVSAVMVMAGAEPRPVLATTIVVSGFIGSWFVIRLGRRRVGVEEEVDR
jgi:hypothetical protein